MMLKRSPLLLVNFNSENFSPSFVKREYRVNLYVLNGSLIELLRRVRLFKKTTSSFHPLFIYLAKHY